MLLKRNLLERNKNMRRLSDETITQNIKSIEPNYTICKISRRLDNNGRNRIYITSKCNNGHITERLYENVMRGHTCIECSKASHKQVCAAAFKKYSNEDVNKILDSNGYEWINEGEYINASSTLKCRCKKCGNISKSNIANILAGRECRVCGKYHKKDTNEYGKYVKNVDPDYELVSDYITSRDKVEILHKSCGTIFETTPDKFTQGSRCPRCCWKISKGEKILRDIFEEYGIKYESEKTFDGCRRKRSLPFDFYLPDYNTCIEYNGEQHYIPVDFFGGQSGYNYRTENDNTKKEFCNNNNINLIYIPFNLCEEEIRSIICGIRQT